MTTEPFNRIQAPQRVTDLVRSLADVRTHTLKLFGQVPDEFLRRRVHSFYSPIGWHFGHIGRTEEYWVLQQAFQRAPIDKELSFLFADLVENPKDNRVNIPDRTGTLDYMARTREAVIQALYGADIEQDDPFMTDGYAWEFAIQHECQHQETIAEMMMLIQKQLPQAPVEPLDWKSDHETTWIKVPGGEFWMGSNDCHAYDNEKNRHRVRVEAFQMAKHPVTAYEWTQFIEDGGYRRQELWSPEGWAWRESEQAEAPEYWLRQGHAWARISPIGCLAMQPEEPAASIGWFEAQAYAKWAGKRLPTEAEWEYAATCDGALAEPRLFPWGANLAETSQASFGLNSWNTSSVGSHPAGDTALGISGMAGSVWEWTADSFLPYPGFNAFPYDGYSKDHMKGEHRVCRGGSWATAAPILRCTFRNWYVPTYRQGILGLRLAN